LLALAAPPAATANAIADILSLFGTSQMKTTWVAGHLDAQRVDPKCARNRTASAAFGGLVAWSRVCHRAFKLSLGPMFTSILGSSRLNRYILRSARDCTALPPFVECADG
jgi:hypothetical protein